MLIFYIWNNGFNRAMSPAIGLKTSMKEEESKFHGFSFARTFKPLKFEILKTPKLSSGEEGYAHALLSQGLKVIDSIRPSTSEKFVVGYAFENSMRLYLALDEPLAMQMPFFIQTRLYGTTEDGLDLQVSKEDFVFFAYGWDNIGFVTKKEFDKMQAKEPKPKL